jgi:hypothetical protein
MKIVGSNGYDDTLIGGIGIDRIYGNGGGDLISAWDSVGDAAADVILAGDGDDLISGFAFDFGVVARSGSRGAKINGGNGYDMLILDSTSTAKVTSLGEIQRVVDIVKVEEIIYNFSSATSKQRFLGTNTNDTLYIGDGGSTADGGNGDDYLFSGGGDDVLIGGNGNDFLSAAGGRNTLTGGRGADYFQFHLTEDYSYSNITDFEAGVDKIALVIDLVDVEFVGETFGDGLRGTERTIDPLGYLHYDRGRAMDRDLFAGSADRFADNMIYERETGSFLQRVYLETDDGIVEHKVLLAQLENRPNLDVNDFVFMFF